MAKLTWLIVLLALCACNAYKILVIFPIPAKSHGILAEGVIRHLLKAGHEVTGIVAFPIKQPHSNFTQVLPESNYKIFNENSMSIKAIMDKEINYQDPTLLFRLMSNLSMSTLQDKNVQNLLQDVTKQFDLVFGEWMFTEIYSTLPAIYNCPFVWFSSLEPHWMVLRLIDEHPNPAYLAHYSDNIAPPFSFPQRVEQLWKQTNAYITKMQFQEEEKKLFHSTIAPILHKRGKAVPVYEDLLFNASLMFGNSHVSLGLATKVPQSYKAIAGYHIDDIVNPLPADLQQILDNAKHGVIYFSMGSNLKSKDLPQSLKDGLLRVFSDLKQTVLWKFEEVLPILPKNVRILTWAPQQSILAHPNCILFITHGGLLSTTEAVHFAKPIIGIPVFADQFGNIDKAVSKGFARRVDLSYTMEKDLKIEINEIIGNPKYAQKVKEWSFIYHDRPITPGRELVHWVEHVIKTGGARHLRSPALLLPWYQKLYLDLAGLVIGAFIISILILKAVIGGIISARKTSEKKKK